MALAPVRAQEWVKFGDGFEFDPLSRSFRRSGRVLKLERIPTEILFFLIEQRGELVTREQIVERIWGKGVFLDTDNSINGAIRKIRQALKDTPDQPRYIQTITGKGYRFIAPVSIEANVPEQKTVDPSPMNQVPAGEYRNARFQYRWPLLGAIAIVCLLLIAASLFWLRSATRRQPATRAMLAVLPFENLTGDSAQDYFSDGFTEELITQLGRLDPSHVGVIARTSVMHYKTSRESLANIARDLGVQYVLEGSVRRDANKLRISAQLIQVADQTHLWARDYDRGVSDLLIVQDEIAQEIADEIELTLTHEPVPISTARAATLTPSAFDAYDLYLKGRYFWNKRSPAGFRQAIPCFQQAIEKDPADARAYAGLADAYAMMSGYFLVPPDEAMPKARAAALKALQIDDSLAEAHTSLAVISQNYDWDWQTAEREYRRAIQLNPNYATAHQWYAESLAFQGRFEDALRESDRARQLDPLSLIIAADNAAIFYFSRQYDLAVERFRSVLDMDPGFARAHLIIAAYAQNRQFKDALAAIETWRRDDEEPWAWAWKAYVYGRAGEMAKAQQASQLAIQSVREQTGESASMLAIAHLGVNDNDQAIVCLERAYREHSHVLTTLKVDPIYDPLRSDPRFQNLLRRVALSH